MKKSELNKREKEQLKDINNFNITIGQKGWHLENRLLEGEILGGIRLNNSSMKNVDIKRTDMTHSDIANSTFEEVEFAGADVSDSRIRDTEFKLCRFTLSKFERAEFTGCVFRGCKAMEARMENAVFRDCEFIDFSDSSGYFDGSRLDRCRVEKSKMEGSSFYYAKLNDVDFKDALMNDVTFSESGFKNVTLLKTSVNFCDFSGSKIEGLIFEKCESKGMSLFNVEISGMRLSYCKGFEGMSVVESSGRDIVIENCEEFFEPRFSLSRFENIVISSCGIKHLILNGSRFSGQNRISDSEIGGMTWAESETNGMIIENSKIGDYLILVRTKFEKLILKNVDYASDLKITADSVSYTDADSFPAP